MENEDYYASCEGFSDLVYEACVKELNRDPTEEELEDMYECLSDAYRHE